MNNTIDCPCYQCELRHPACHSKCQDYKQWSDKRLKQKQEYNKSSDTIIKEYWIDKYHRKKYGK